MRPEVGATLSPRFLPRTDSMHSIYPRMLCLFSSEKWSYQSPKNSLRSRCPLEVLIDIMFDLQQGNDRPGNRFQQQIGDSVDAQDTCRTTFLEGSLRTSRDLSLKTLHANPRHARCNESASVAYSSSARISIVESPWLTLYHFWICVKPQLTDVR